MGPELTDEGEDPVEPGPGHVKSLNRNQAPSPSADLRLR